MTILIARNVVIDLEKKIASFKNHADKKILEVHYVAPEVFKRYPFLVNWYGGTQEKKDIESGAGVHIIGPNDWKDTPRVGYCFYGLLEYEEHTKVSVLGLPKNILPLATEVEKYPQLTPILNEKTGECFGIQETVHVRQQMYWLSHPITEIFKPKTGKYRHHNGIYIKE